MKMNDVYKIEEEKLKKIKELAVELGLKYNTAEGRGITLTEPLKNPTFNMY